MPLLVLNVLLVYLLHFGGICLAVIMTFLSVRPCIGSVPAGKERSAVFSPPGRAQQPHAQEPADVVLKHDDGKCHCFLPQPSI